MDRSLAVERRDPPPTTLLVAAGTAVTAAAAFTAATRWPYAPPLLMVLSVAAVATYLCCGLLLWRLRPWSRVGPVLLLTAPTWLITRYQGPDVSAFVLFMANWLAGLPLLLLAHLVLGYPTGRLQTWPRRVTVGVGAVLVVPLGFLFNSVHGQDLSLFGQVLTFLVAGLALSKWAGSRGSLRRLLRPLPFVAVLFASTAVPNVLGAFGTDSPGAFEVTVLVAAAAQPLVPIAFVLGLLSTRRARGGVADLVVELDAGPSPAGVRDLLARALRDPSLQLGYWAPERHGFVDHTGRALPPPHDDGRACVAIEDGGEPLALVVHDRALVEERELVEAALAAARLALVNERLQALVRAQLVDVSASRARIVEAADTARRRLERDLHDGAQQRLLALGMRLQLASALAEGAVEEHDEVRAELRQAQDELAAALTELRELARGLHSTRLHEGGLATALGDLAARTPLPVRVRCTPARCSELVESTAWFVVTEAVSNAVKHAGATAVDVRVDARRDGLHVEVVDDGAGGAAVVPGGGLAGLRDRVLALDGDLVLHSRLGAGTRVTAHVPGRSVPGQAAAPTRTAPERDLVLPRPALR